MQASQNNNVAKWTGSSWFFNPGTEKKQGFYEKSSKFKIDNVNLKRLVGKLWFSNNDKSRLCNMLPSHAANGKSSDLLVEKLCIDSTSKTIRMKHRHTGPDPSHTGQHWV